MPNRVVAGADLAFLVPLRPESESKTLSQQAKQPFKIGFIAGSTSNATSIIAACCGVRIPACAHHKTVVSHCVHPVKACPVPLRFLCMSDRTTSCQRQRTNPFSKRRRDGSFTPFSSSYCIRLIQSQHTAKLRQIFRQRSIGPFNAFRSASVNLS